MLKDALKRSAKKVILAKYLGYVKKHKTVNGCKKTLNLILVNKKKKSQNTAPN